VWSVICCLVLAACQRDISSIEMVEVLQHENGLIVNRPKGLVAQKTQTGFTMTDAASVRNPLTITIGIYPLSKDANLAPSWFGLFGSRYRVRKSEGGSGGEDYRLTATASLQECWLVISANQQAEFGEPNFLEAWAILDTASAGPKLTC
jgi:hypothetical protein